MNNSLKIGIIGSGFASEHIKAINQIPHTELVAVCSRNQTTANEIIKLSSSQNTRYYPFEKYLHMLRSEKLDAIYISLPPFLHGQIEIACAEHVKGIFIEKPVALDLKTATDMSNAFQQAESIVSTGYMNRYRSNILSAKSYFTNHPPILFNGTFCGGMPTPYWWRQRKLSGGQLTEQCTHIIDTIRFISGEITEIQALATNGFINNINNYNVDDAIVMNFLTKNRATGSIQTSCFTKPSDNAAIGIHLTIANREKVYRFNTHACNLTIQHSSSSSETILSTEDPILLENQTFINALRTNDSSQILSPFQDAVETLKVSLAANLSIKEKRNIYISEL